jgi:hypothetical protein
MFWDLFFLFLGFFAYIFFLVKMEVIYFNEDKKLSFCLLPEEKYFLWFFVFTVVIVVLSHLCK